MLGNVFCCFLVNVCAPVYQKQPSRHSEAGAVGRSRSALSDLCRHGWETPHISQPSHNHMYFYMSHVCLLLRLHPITGVRFTQCVMRPCVFLPSVGSQRCSGNLDDETSSEHSEASILFRLLHSQKNPHICYLKKPSGPMSPPYSFTFKKKGP